MTTSIFIDKLTKRYDLSGGLRAFLTRAECGKPMLAVDDVTLTISEGELFGLLGSNGAGKSTLIKMIAGLVLPTSGTANIKGVDLSDPISVKRMIGLVNGEERSFFWRLSVRDNLTFFGKLHGVSGRKLRKRISEITAVLDLSEFIDTRVDRCTTGMKQRLGIARTLLHNPPVLFMDEPTKSVDPKSSNALREYIRRICREENKTIVLVTHQLHEAEQICDRVAIMSKGKVAVVDDMRSLRKNLGTGQSISFYLREKSEELIKRLISLPGVKDVTVDDKNENRILVSVRLVDDGYSSLNEAFSIMTKSQVHIENVNVAQAGLSEIFEKYTND